jgi:arginyl-tRNA synthetase
MTEQKETWLIPTIANTITQLYQKEIGTDAVTLQKTRKEFPGDITLVCFGLARLSGKKPQETAEEIGKALVLADARIANYNVVNGFLNIEITFKHWTDYLANYNGQVNTPDANKKRVMIEYSSPNTNKPLHLGHVRNNLLGYSVALIAAEAGHTVYKVNLVNDRGIHICKSMIAWKKQGNGETPQSSAEKGDHLVGKYYVIFDQLLRAESSKLHEEIEQGNFDNVNPTAIAPIQSIVDQIKSAESTEKIEGLKGDLKQLVNNQTPLMKEAQQMLRDWEEGKKEVIDLWKTMNSWVYEGFDATYKSLGVSFDKMYYESETYLLGKDIVMEGVKKGVLYQKEDGSIWIDLTDAGLDYKLLMRSDGTSVYMTQDIGTAVLRNEELSCKDYVYVVGNEQDYHFNVLKLVLQRMGYSWADGIYHLSYGMVDLPSGRMKSREGTVVDADDLIEEIVTEAKSRALELGKTDGMSEEEQNKLFEVLGKGALKYYILKVDPKKRMIFNPEESIDLQGNTGPFIQYTYARIQSLKQKASGKIDSKYDENALVDEANHRSMIRSLEGYSEAVLSAAASYSPAIIANYMYDLAKEYNSFYHDFPIMKEDNKDFASFRLKIADKVGLTLKKCASMLGIEMPDRM